MAVVGRGPAFCAAHPCALAGGRSVNLRCVEPTRLLCACRLAWFTRFAQAARQGGGSARQGVVSRLDAAVRCSRRRRSLRGLPLGTAAARPRSPFSGGRGRRPALGAVSAGGQPWLVSLPAEGRAFIVIVRDSRKLDSQRPRPAGWMGGRLQGSYHYSLTRYSTTCAAFCLSTPARFSAPVCTPRTCAASRTCRQAAASPGA